MFIGSIVGGVVTGVIAGPPVTTYFAYQIRPIADPQFLAPFSIIASSVVAFSLINYSLEKMSWAQLRRSTFGALAGVVGGGLVGLLVFGPLYLAGIVDAVIEYMSTPHVAHKLEIHSETTFAFMTGGLIYGFFLGIVLGSVFAFARYFTPGEVATGETDQDIVLWPLPKKV